MTWSMFQRLLQGLLFANTRLARHFAPKPEPEGS